MTRDAMPSMLSRSRFEFLRAGREISAGLMSSRCGGFLSLGATQISAENQSVERRGKRFAAFAKNVSSAQQNVLHALKLFCRFPKMSNCPHIWPAAQPKLALVSPNLFWKNKIYNAAALKLFTSAEIIEGAVDFFPAHLRPFGLSDGDSVKLPYRERAAVPGPPRPHF